jgi:hypothetical protein
MIVLELTVGARLTTGLLIDSGRSIAKDCRAVVAEAIEATPIDRIRAAIAIRPLLRIPPEELSSLRVLTPTLIPASTITLLIILFTPTSISLISLSTKKPFLRLFLSLFLLTRLTN